MSLSGPTCPRPAERSRRPLAAFPDRRSIGHSNWRRRRRLHSWSRREPETEPPTRRGRQPERTPGREAQTSFARREGHSLCAGIARREGHSLAIAGAVSHQLPAIGCQQSAVGSAGRTTRSIGGRASLQSRRRVLLPRRDSNVEALHSGSVGLQRALASTLERPTADSRAPTALSHDGGWTDRPRVTSPR